LVSSAIGKAVSQVLSAVKLDDLFSKVGADKLFSKAGFKFSLSRFVGEVVKWFLIVVFLIASLEVLGLSQVNVFLGNVVLGYLPQVIIAALIIVFATVISDWMRKFIEGSAKAMGVKSARFAGSVAKWAIWIFAVIIALSELGIAPAFMQILFTGIVAMLALAGGLAFGLGGKEAAGGVVKHLGDSMSHKE
jgi:small-conductance mechanosensitive channel